MPHWNMPGSSFYIFANKPKYERLATQDIVVVQRCCTRQQYEFLKVLKKLELKMVYDLDDDMWNIPPFNPAHGPLAKFKEGFLSCMQLVDVISVSTLPLAKVVQNQLRKTKGRDVPIMVAENKIDIRMFSTPPERDEDRVIVGWQGSTSHLGDLPIVEDALTACAAEFPKVEFQFRGIRAPKSLQTFKNVTFKYWLPVPEYAARMPQWGWSIALAPLAEVDFNASKSSIKMVEAAYTKTPCLASWLAPYDRFASFDPELRWLLCAGPSAWAPKIRELINDPARRKDLGERAHAVMLKHFSFQEPHEGWNRIFETVRGLPCQTV